MFQETMKIHGVKDTTRIVSFDSIHEFISPKETENSKEVAAKTKDELSGNIKWYGASSVKEYKEILENGHTRYVELVRECDVKFSEPKSLRRRPIRGEYGDEVCIHAINCGNSSTAWRRKTPKVRVGYRNVRIVVNLTQNCGVAESEMKWVGVSALACAEALEGAGYRVAIDAFMGSDGFSDEESCILLTPIKTYDTMLDVQGLTSMLCFPGFYRGPGFMNWGLSEGNVQYGYGTAMNDDVLKKYIVPKYYSEPTELVETISNETKSKEKAEEEIQRLMDSVERANLYTKAAA